MNVIYIRTSTEEQTPELQVNSCKALAQKLGLECEIISEQVSGWKDIKRDEFDKLKKLIMKWKVQNLIVWDIDRIYRNRKRLIDFFQLCKLYKCKIYSVRQGWFEDLNKIPSPFDEIMHGLMIQMLGWLAEEESVKKSERVKLAVKKKNGKSFSKYGRRWGRKEVFSNKRLIAQVKKLASEGLSYRQIIKDDAVYYYNKSNVKKKPSVFTIHTILKGEEGEESGNSI